MLKKYFQYLKHDFITDCFNAKKMFLVSIFGLWFDTIVIDLSSIKYFGISNEVIVVIFCLTYSLVLNMLGYFHSKE